MNKSAQSHWRNDPKQRGAAAVEFALVMILFFILLLAIVELGRVLYLWNTVQEVTRRAAREAVVRWTDKKSEAISLALFGGDSLPAGWEVTGASITIEYLDKNRAPINTNQLPTSPDDNVEMCNADEANCIRYVSASLADVTYQPMIGLFENMNFGPFNIDLRINLPSSTVVMPAESLGYVPPAS